MPDKKKEKRKFLEKLTHKYRLVLLNDRNFQEVGFLRITRLNVVVVAGIFILILVAFFWSVIAYTPVRELIPGYPDAEMRNNIVRGKIRLDSLEIELKYRDSYFDNLKSIISGERTKDYTGSSDAVIASLPVIIEPSGRDSLPPQEINFNLPPTNLSSAGSTSVKLDKLHFFSPVRGMVTNSFNPLANHFGTDVVAGPNEVVKATLDGTVTIATWTLETGYIIQIQHNNNLISVYKHNAEILKKVGSKVKAGDAIAIIGNSGELTTGPHLHFEIWQNGNPLNPEDLIVF